MVLTPDVGRIIVGIPSADIIDITVAVIINVIAVYFVVIDPCVRCNVFMCVVKTVIYDRYNDGIPGGGYATLSYIPGFVCIYICIQQSARLP